MPTDMDYRLKDDPFISELFRQEYAGLVRYAQIIFRKRGGYVDPQGRAEEIVQETFFLAIEKREELIAREDKRAWLISAVSYKVRDALKEDRKWIKGLLLLPDEADTVPFREPEEVPEYITNDEYRLLRRLYVEGYTYKDLCRELGVSKSALAMKISRIKKTARQKYKIFSDKV